jgi:hypothetical protein
MSDVQFIIDEVRKAKPFAMIMGGVMVAMAIGASFIPVESGAAAWVPFAKWGGLAAIGALGVFLFVTALRPAEKDAAVVLLTTAPQSIVWAHVVQVRTNGQHTATVIKMYTDSGKQVDAPLPRTEKGARRGIDLVRAVAPRATTGYSAEREAQFAKDPASLRQA